MTIKTINPKLITVLNKYIEAENDFLINFAQLQNLILSEEIVDQEEHLLIKEELQNNKEGLVLFLMNKCESFLNIESPSKKDGYSLVTCVDMDDKMDTRQYTDLKHIESGLATGLTLVDAYQHEDEDSEDDHVKYLSTYLYGKPEMDEWTDKQVIKFKELDEIVEINS